MIRAAILLAIFAAGFAAGGFSVFQAWSVDALQAERDQLHFEKLQTELALLSEQEGRRRAQELAAQQARRAQDAIQSIQALEVQRDAIIAEFEREAQEPKGCLCTWRPGDRERLQREIPIRAPAPRPAPAGQLRVDALPGSGDPPEPPGGGR